ncbi:MAG: LytTR family DNA-binding domain-containing protein [Bacteroidales bacterium]|nr:LytTR family DNA-binding domain-containing protein [Bacteroidales bacterium]
MQTDEQNTSTTQTAANPPLRVLAIDDEPLALRQLVAYIGRVPQLQLMAACHSAVEAREWLQHDTADALFCDINMPDLNGLDFVRQLPLAPLVVFTTAYSEYAIDGFRVDAVDYLLKPFTFNEFNVSAQRLCQRHALIMAASGSKATTEESEPQVLYVRSDHRSLAIAVNDIIRVQAMGEYLRIYLSTQPRPVLTLMSMKRIEETLSSDVFMRIHRSHIINLKQISEVGKGRIRLMDNSVLPVGDNYRTSLIEWVQQHRV